MDWLNLLAVQGTLKSLLKQCGSKAINSSALSFLYNPTLTPQAQQPLVPSDSTLAVLAGTAANSSTGPQNASPFGARAVLHSCSCPVARPSTAAEGWPRDCMWSNLNATPSRVPSKPVNSGSLHIVPPALACHVIISVKTWAHIHTHTQGNPAITEMFVMNISEPHSQWTSLTSLAQEYPLE